MARSARIENRIGHAYAARGWNIKMEHSMFHLFPPPRAW